MNALDFIRSALSRIAVWWWKEFESIAPPAFTRVIRGRPGHLILVPGATHVDVFSNDERSPRTRFPFDDRLPSALIDILAREKRRRRNVQVGLELRPEDTFRRSLVIPAPAQKALPKILLDDLSHKTPFVPEDIVHGHSIRPEASNRKRLQVTHVIVRRDIVIRALRRLGLPSDAADFVRVHATDGGDVSINLQQAAAPMANSWKRIEVALACSAALLLAAALATIYCREGAILDEITTQLAILKPRVVGIETTIKRREKVAKTLLILQKRKDERSTAEILDILTKTLPDNSWLQRVQINGVPEDRKEIVIAGYSSNAANLVALFDASGAFEAAALTSAVAIDPIEGRERFTLKTYAKKRGQDHDGGGK